MSKNSGKNSPSRKRARARQRAHVKAVRGKASAQCRLCPRALTNLELSYCGSCVKGLPLCACGRRIGVHAITRKPFARCYACECALWLDAPIAGSDAAWRRKYADGQAGYIVQMADAYYGYVKPDGGSLRPVCAAQLDWHAAQSAVADAAGCQ